MMGRWLRWTGFGLAMAMLIFSFTNASWLAAPPQGALKLIAARAEDESGCVTARMAERAFIDGATYLVLARILKIQEIEEVLDLLVRVRRKLLRR